VIPKSLTNNALVIIVTHMTTMTLGQARDLLGLSKRRLDILAGVREGTVHQIESAKNRRPAYVTVVKIIRALRKAGLANISAEQIFPVADDEPASDAA
jgi:predicted transcriptional regulator